MAEFTADLNPKGQIPLADMLKMQYYGAQADIANLEAMKAREVQKEMPLVQGFLADPENKLQDGSFDLDKINKVLPTIAPLSGADYAKKITDITKNHIETNRALNELSTQQRQIFGSIYGAHAAAGTQDPKQVAASLERLKTDYPQLAPAIDGQVKNMIMAPGGPEFTKKLYQARNEVLSPKELIDQFAPKASMQEFAGVKTPVITKPSVMGEEPKVGVSMLGGTTPLEPKAETPSAKARDLIKYDTELEYTGPKAPLQLDVRQEKSYDTGRTLLDASNRVANAAKEQHANTRGIYENIASATGSRPGQLVRSGGKWLLGDAQLEMLNKNIARMGAASEVLGAPATTDMARQTQAVINGSADLTAKALEDIVSRADATVTAAEQFNKGYNKFVEKKGINGYIQHHKFQSAWADNFDLRMAQMDALAESNSPNAKEKINEIYATIPKDQRSDFKKKWENIHALQQGIFK